jgi:hypothetical protein
MSTRPRVRRLVAAKTLPAFLRRWHPAGTRRQRPRAMTETCKTSSARLVQAGRVTVDLAAAEAFMAAHARVLDRRRLQLHLGTAGPAAVLAAVDAYRNPGRRLRLGPGTRPAIPAKPAWRRAARLWGLPG